MEHRLKQLGQLAGIDKAIIYSILGRIVQASGGIITIIFIARYLVPKEQGYYYTFTSIVAIQVFFELGLNSIITQFVAHEAINIKYVDNEYVGDEVALSRLASLLKFCIKVFSLLSLILFIVLWLGGLVFFSSYKENDYQVEWQYPWIILALATSFMLLVNPILAYLEGLGKVKEIARMRLGQQTLTLLTIAIVFYFGGGLYALGLGSLVSFIFLSISLIISQSKLLLNIYQNKSKWKVHYKREIFPFQFRIALSWISGYFIFQLFNPVLFATSGAIAAGQMGMTLGALSGITSLSMSWVATKVPLFSSLIAEKAYEKLDSLFKRTLTQVCVVNFLLLMIFVVATMILDLLKIPLRARLLPLLPLTQLCLVTFVNQFIFSWATYLRCHKQEPLVKTSIVTATLCCISTLGLGHLFGLAGIVTGYTCITTLISLPWAYTVFKRKKSEWHLES